MSYETFLSRDEQIDRAVEARYRRELFADEQTHCRDERDYETLESGESFYLPVQQSDVEPFSFLAEAGVTRAEGEAFLMWIDRKPAQVERLQGELFPEVA